MTSHPLPRRAFTGALASLALGGCRSAGCQPQKQRAQTKGSTRQVVMISIDGLRPDYLLEADALGLAIPRLRRLMSTGAVAAGMTSVWPTVTYPAHTTLVTGARPTRHGVATNYPFDPMRTKPGAWLWYADAIRTRTLWNATRAAGLTSAACYWPVTVGAEVDWNLPQIWKTKTDDDDELLRATATPGLADAMRAGIGALPAEHRSDLERSKGAAWLLREKRPELLLAYLTDLDTSQHATGPFSRDARTTLEAIDAGVGRIIDAANPADQTTFVVVSDHGFLPVSRLTRPYVLFAKEKLVEIERDKLKTWRAALMPAGGMCGVVLSDPSDAALRSRVGEVLSRAAADRAIGIRRVIGEAELGRLGGFPGAAFALEAETGFELSPSLDGPLTDTASHLGTHGYAPDRPEMHAALVLSGAGIKAGAKLGVVSMLDVAPTVAALLGLTLPDAEGRVLAAALG